MPRIWLSLLRDVTSQILDENWESYCLAYQTQAGISKTAVSTTNPDNKIGWIGFIVGLVKLQFKRKLSNN